MLIDTKYLGEVEISLDEIIKFPWGLLGFEDHHDFVVLNIPGNEHIKILQDINHSYLSFLLIHPWEFFKDYEIDIPDEYLYKIEITQENNDKIDAYNIVTIGAAFKDSTANLLAPIIINIENKIGKQFILNDSIYSTKHRLFPEGKGE